MSSAAANTALSRTRELSNQLALLTRRVKELEASVYPPPQTCPHGVIGTRCDTCYGEGLLR